MQHVRQEGERDQQDDHALVHADARLAAAELYRRRGHRALHVQESGVRDSRNWQADIFGENWEVLKFNLF